MPQNFLPVAKENASNFYELIRKGVEETASQSSDLDDGQISDQQPQIMYEYIKAKILNYVEENPAEFVPRCISCALASIILVENASEFCLILLTKLAQSYKLAAALLINENKSTLSALKRSLALELDNQVTELLNLLIEDFPIDKRENYIQRLVKFYETLQPLDPLHNKIEEKQKNDESEDNFIIIYSRLLELETSILKQTKSGEEAEKCLDEIKEKLETNKIIKKEEENFIKSIIDKLESILNSMKKAIEDANFEDIEEHKEEESQNEILSSKQESDKDIEENKEEQFQNEFQDLADSLNSMNIASQEDCKPNPISLLQEEMRKNSAYPVKYKSRFSYSNLEKLVCSFLNFRGGVIYFGIKQTENNQDIVGVEVTERDLINLENTLKQIATHLHIPKDTYEKINIKRFDLQNPLNPKLCVIQIKIPEEKNKSPYLYEKEFRVHTAQGRYKTPDESSVALIKKCNPNDIDFTGNNFVKSEGSSLCSH